MADSSKPAHRSTGTYLYVRERAKGAADEQSSADAPPAPRLPRVDDSFLEPAAPVDATRLRYVRPRLDPDALDPRLAFLLDAEDPICEPYREAAGRLARVRPDDRRVVLTAPTAGSGTTLSCLNLACALAEQQRVTVVDLNLARPGVLSALGVHPRDDLLDLARARRRDRRAPIDLLLIRDRLALLAPREAPTADDARRLLDGPELPRLLDEVMASTDILLIDGPPTLEDALGPLQPLAPHVLLVVRPADLATGAYERSLTHLGGFGVLGTLVNGAPER